MKNIWIENKGENWICVDQAMASALDRHYTQRVYKVGLMGNSAISSTLIELPKPVRFIGAIKNMVHLKSNT